MVRKLIACITLFLAMPLAAQSVATQAQAAQAADAAAIIAAMEDLAARRHDAAIARLDPIIAGYDKQYAQEKRTVYCAGSTEETLAYMLTAAAAKKSAVAILPGWCSALFVKGFVLIDAKRLADGQVWIERAIAMRPNYPHYLNELGFVLQQQHQLQASYDAFAKAADNAAIGGKDQEAVEKARALRGMGFALIEQGKWGDAEAKFKQCLELDPNDAKAKNELRYIAENRPKSA